MYDSKQKVQGKDIFNSLLKTTTVPKTTLINVEDVL